MSRFWRLIRNLVILFFATSIAWVILARFIPVYLTPLMIIRSVEALADGKTPRNSKDWVSIDNISPNMVQAVVASEDNLFMEHHGFSLTDINKAIKHNKKANGFVEGALFLNKRQKMYSFGPGGPICGKGWKPISRF